MDLPAPEPWALNGACSGAGDPDLWYSEHPVDVALARSVCGGCPSVVPCREFGRRERFGVWGGLTPAQRQASFLELPPLRWCSWCREVLPDDVDGSRHPECDRPARQAARAEARQDDLVHRVCERCDTAMWAQARACLICRHIQGHPLPNRPWPPLPESDP